MRSYSWPDQYSSFGFRFNMTKTVKALIVINVALFILIHLLDRLPWLALFGLVPRYVFAKFRLWQLVTYMFLHAGLWHLVINMLMLAFFAPAIESSWGRRQFLFFYFFTGIGAGLCSWLAAWRSYIPVIGASGAVFGILVAYALMFPQTVILFFFFFPMNIRHAVLLLAGINLLGALTSPNSGIAYFAHLGGGVFAYLYLRSEWIARQISYLTTFNFKGQRRARQSEKPLTQQALDRQIDIILDKISKYGLKSLSRKERKILEAKGKKQ